MGRFGYNGERNQLPYRKQAHNRIISSIVAKASLSVPAYKPLPGTHFTRFLKILRPSPRNGNLAARMTCVLRICPLNATAPNFAALSYAWANPFTDSGTEYLSDVVISVRDYHGKTYRDHHVSRNLYEALLQVHESQWQSWLWVDSVCINQNDLAEKESQVQIMGNIYAKATKTIAWLGRPGPEKADIDYLFGPFCQYICDWQLRHGEGRFPEIAIMPPPWPKGATDITFVGSDVTISARQIAALLRFNRRVRYLTRLWTIQEIALSREVVFLYGSSILPIEGHLQLPHWLEVSYATVFPLERVRAGESALDESDRRLAAPGTQIALRIKGWAEAMRQGNDSSQMLQSLQSSLFGANCPKTRRLAWLERLLATTNTLDCTDERDHYYALLGLINLAEPSLGEVRPDYAISLGDVLRTLTFELLSGLPYMTAFGLLPIYHLRNFKLLPSWVIDLTTQFENTDDWVAGLQGRLMSNGQSVASDAFPHRDDVNSVIKISGITLLVYGLRCDRIWKVYELQNHGRTVGDIDHDRIATMDELIKIFSLALDLPTGCKILEAIAISSSLSPKLLERNLPGTDLPGFWAALLMIPFMHSQVQQSGDADIRAEAKASLSRFYDLVDELKERDMLPYAVTSLLSNENELFDRYTSKAGDELTIWDQQALSYIREVSNLIGRRAIMLTENGNVGSVPRGTKEGDEVWLLCRARVPQILRPTTPDDRYLILGEAYVHEGMNGQLVEHDGAGIVHQIEII